MGVEAGRRQETGRQAIGGGNAVSTVGSAYRADVTTGITHSS